MLLRDLTDSEKFLFQNEYNTTRKNPTTGVLLALFLGGIGAHHFYMGSIGLGVLYLVFCWTFIPGIVAFVEMFFMSKRVRTYNADKAQEIMLKIKALRVA
jgi:TM2 domain-containing membrane protein YozV